MSEMSHDVPAPSAGDFDLIEWIDGHHTYPEYTVTVHTDKNAVAQANRLLDEIAADQEEIREAEEALALHSAEGGITDTPPDMGRVQDLQHHVIRKRRERAMVLERAKGSALTLLFRRAAVSDDEDEDNVFSRALTDLKQQFPDVDLSDQQSVTRVVQDNPEVGRRHTAFIVHQMLASVTTASGNVLERGTRLPLETVSRLLTRLDPSDLQRVTMNMNLALSGAQLREEQIDAGFPR